VPKFRDLQGKTFTVKLDGKTSLRICQQCDLDPRIPFEEFTRRLHDDGELLVDVIYAAVEVQARAANITPEEFAKRLDVEAATEALIQAAIDRMPSRLRRATRRSYLENLKNECQR